MLSQPSTRMRTPRTTSCTKLLYVLCAATALAFSTIGCTEVRSGRGALDTDQSLAPAASGDLNSGFAMSGVVTEVTDRSVVLKDANMAKYTVLIDTSTMVTLDGNEAVPGSLKSGHFANVIVDDDSGDKMTARAIDAISSSGE